MKVDVGNLHHFQIYFIPYAEGSITFTPFLPNSNMTHRHHNEEAECTVCFGNLEAEVYCEYKIHEGMSIDWFTFSLTFFESSSIIVSIFRCIIDKKKIISYLDCNLNILRNNRINSQSALPRLNFDSTDDEWQASPICLDCIDMMRKDQWSRFVTLVDKADCKASLLRLCMWFLPIPTTFASDYRIYTVMIFCFFISPIFDLSFPTSHRPKSSSLCSRCPFFYLPTTRSRLWTTRRISKALDCTHWNWRSPNSCRREARWRARKIYQTSLWICWTFGKK